MQLVTLILRKHSVNGSELGEGENGEGIGSNESVECLESGKEGMNKLFKEMWGIGRMVDEINLSSNFALQSPLYFETHVPEFLHYKWENIL